MTYTSIGASTDLAKIRLSIKIISISTFLLTLSAYLVGYMLAALMGIVIFNLSTAVSVLNYRKRDIVRLTSPSGGMRGILASIKTVFSHAFDLLIAPMFTMIIVIDLMMFFGYDPSILTTGTVMFVIMTLVQISPLRWRKDFFTRIAHKHISSDLDKITVSRCMREGVDRRTKDYRKYIQYQISAEESIRVNSQFLTLSSGMKVMLMSMARFVMPIAGTVGPMLLRMIL